jgi:hypothetical protein
MPVSDVSESGQSPERMTDAPGDHAAGRTQGRRRVMAEEVYTVRVHHEPGEEPGEAKHAELEDEPGSVAGHRMLARTA